MSATLKRYVRHWKDHFSLDSDLIFIKRLRLGLDFKPFAEPGDDITPEIRTALGAHRLKMWWVAGFVGLKRSAVMTPPIAQEQAPPAAEKEPAPKAVLPSAPPVVPVPPPPPPETGLPKNVRQLSGNRFEVRMPNGSLRTVLGLDKAIKTAQGG